MALNLRIQNHLIENVLPEVEIRISASGITLISENRLSMPRFLPFDYPGRCRDCRSTECEIDFITTKEGVTVYCTRIKGCRFVEFDQINELPGHCFFRIKNKGRVFNVEHGNSPSPRIASMNQQAKLSSSSVKNGNSSAFEEQSLPNLPSLKTPEKPADFVSTISQISTLLGLIIPSPENSKKLSEEIKQIGGQNFEEFFDILSTATSFTASSPIELESRQEGAKITNEQIENYNGHKSSLENPKVNGLEYQNLINILSAALTFIGFVPTTSKHNKIESDTKTEQIEESTKGVEGFFESLTAATLGIPDTNSAPIQAKEENMEVEMHKAEANIENILNSPSSSFQTE